jgi:uncharacterized protein
MYEGPDQTWKSQPQTMSIRTTSATFQRIAEYAATTNLRSVSIVVHGGEPLLLGPLKLKETLTIGKEIINAAGVHANFLLQTNCTLMTPEIANVLNSFDVAVGVSVDGTVDTHNRRRLSRSGGGTHEKTLRGLRILQDNTSGRQPYSAICVIDIESDPAEQLRAIANLGIKNIDFLLPDINWDTAPELDQNKVARWLIDLFEVYMQDRSGLRIRTFQTILKLMFGAKWGSDAWGEQSACTLIVETNGDYHYHDALKMAFEGAGSSGLNVHDSAVAEVTGHHMVAMMTNRIKHVAPSCSTCAFKRICGGGHIVHRYSSTNYFDNPSVYCAAIKTLLEHIASRLAGKNLPIAID